MPVRHGRISAFSARHFSGLTAVKMILAASAVQEFVPFGENKTFRHRFSCLHLRHNSNTLIEYLIKIFLGHPLLEECRSDCSALRFERGDYRTQSSKFSRLAW